MPKLEISLEALRRRTGIKWTDYPEDVIPAWIADLDFPVAEPIKQAINDVMAREDFGYIARDAQLKLAQAYSQRMQARCGWKPDPELTQSFGDLIQALRAAVATFSDAGGGIVIQTPIYHPFLDIVSEMERVLVDNPMQVGPQGYAVDVEGLKRSVTPDTRMLLLCNPHNPTGRVLTRRELEQIASIAITNDLIVVSDEVHSDLVFPGQAHIPIASLSPAIAKRTITLSSASKAFNIAGLKCALMHFGHADLMHRHLDGFHPRLLGPPNVFGIEATLAAWRSGDDWLAALLEQLDRNRNRISEVLSERAPEIRYFQPEASFLAWLDCTSLELDSAPYDFFLEEARVGLSDGREFSSYTDHFVRLNFATPGPVLDEILDRMMTAVANRRRRAG